MSEFITTLFAFLVITPLQSEVSECLQGAQAAEIVAAARACISAEAPRLLQQAQDNWAWAAAQAFGISFGITDPVTLLSPDNAHCAKVVDRLRNREAEGENA